MAGCRLNKSDCLGFGLATLDYISLVDKFPRPGAKLQALECAIEGGGPVATAMATIARLGGSAAFVGKLGRDSAAGLVLRSFHDAGVNTGNVIISKECRTPTASVLVEQGSGRRTVLLSQDKRSGLKASDIKQSLISRSRSIHLDGRDLPACRKAAGIARKLGVATFLDVGSIRNRVDSLFPYIDHLIVSQEYALGFTGCRSARAAKKKLFRDSMQTLVVTRGTAGAIGFDGRNWNEQPAFRVRVKDTTGAGDAYHGGYIFAHLAGGSMSECMRFAAAVAALNCRELGGRRGLPMLSEVKKLVKAGKTL